MSEQLHWDMTSAQGTPVRMAFAAEDVYKRQIMDPPSYGRGPGGEIWKLEDCIYDLISQCEEVLSDTPLFLSLIHI